MKQLTRVFVVTVVALLALVFLPGGTALADGGVGTTPCPGSLPTRLEVGDTGFVARSFSSLRDVPAGYAFRIMTTGAEFTVVDGPTCAFGLTFFKLNYGGGVVGWSAESEVTSIWGSNLYYLAPTAEPEPVPPGTCSGSLTPRLEVGGVGVVARAFSSLRTAPAGPIIVQMSHGAGFNVLEGPVCAGTDDLAWFRIGYPDGPEGWASESQRVSEWGTNLYWLAPQ
jgi:hypothetical protein